MGRFAVGYQVSFIGETDLPKGIEWVAVRIGELCCLFIKLSVALSAWPVEATRTIRRMALESAAA